MKERTQNRTNQIINSQFAFRDNKKLAFWLSGGACWWKWLLYVGLCAAGSSELILHQVCVVWGGDVVVIEGLVHVLIQVFMSRVEDGALILVQVHQETIFGHVFLLLR